MNDTEEPKSLEEILDWIDEELSVEQPEYIDGIENIHDKAMDSIKQNMEERDYENMDVEKYFKDNE